MKYTFTIDDKKLIDTIHRLRGKKPAAEFLGLCLRIGIKVAEENAVKLALVRRQQAQGKQAQGKQVGGPQFRFEKSKSEFRELAESDVAAALKNSKSAAAIEVGRLVKVYMTQFDAYRRANGGQLPPLRIRGAKPIEKLALQMSAEAMKGKVAAIGEK